ncbi:hypothetical protein [Stutzerimonas stutzeri]|uniref:hypothetical protein n=1 Tax=Stutzerimonas stutzeri TaxID=316 RepID=UPI003AF6E2EA
MTKHDLKELAAMGAELGAAKSENERLRGLLRDVNDVFEGQHPAPGLVIARVRNTLSHHAEPTNTYTAVDMATAAAQGFRDGQAAVEQAAAQDDDYMPEGIVAAIMQSETMDIPAMAANALREKLTAPIAQTAPQGKFRMGDMVKKSTGSEWVGRVVGWYSTEQTKEGYAVESSAHRNSVQIYPAKALELVPMAAKEA